MVLKHEAEGGICEGLGHNAARVLLRLQIWLLHWFHFLLLGLGLQLKQQQQI